MHKYFKTLNIKKCLLLLLLLTHLVDSGYAVDWTLMSHYRASDTMTRPSVQMAGDSTG